MSEEKRRYVKRIGDDERSEIGRLNAMKIKCHRGGRPKGSRNKTTKDRPSYTTIFVRKDDRDLFAEMARANAISITEFFHYMVTSAQSIRKEDENANEIRSESQAASDNEQASL